MQSIRKDIQVAARTAAKVSILGETGVGKDIVARGIHAASGRSRQAFVTINCSGIPESLLESELFGHTRGSFTGAERDRAGLHTRIDVRVISATNRDLHGQIAEGTFREDLFYRLNVIRIDVPPLRDRGDDIMPLLHHFLGDAARTHGLREPTVTPDAAQLLVAYEWPGNVRELRNVAERLVLRDCRAIKVADLPSEFLTSGRPSALGPRRGPVAGFARR